MSEKNLILANIPPRYDLSPYSLKIKSIRSLNRKLNNLVRRSKSNIRVLDLSSKSETFLQCIDCISTIKARKF